MLLFISPQANNVFTELKKRFGKHIAQRNYSQTTKENEGKLTAIPNHQQLK